MLHDTKAVEQLEKLIDQAGLKELIADIAEVCWAKSQHIQANWQDKHLAKQWDRAGGILAKVRKHLEV